MTPSEPRSTATESLSAAPGDFMDWAAFLRLWLRWWWLLAVIPAIGVGAAAVLNARAPKIHEVSLVVKMGVLGVKPDGHPLPLDAIATVKGQIESGVFQSPVGARFESGPFKNSVKFRATNPAGTDLLVLTTEAEAEQVAEGRKALQYLLEALQQHYEPLLQERGVELDREIAPKLNEIARLQAEMMDVDEKIALARRVIEEASEQIARHQSALKRNAAARSELQLESRQAREGYARWNPPKSRASEEGGRDRGSPSLLEGVLAGQQALLMRQLRDEMRDLEEEEDRIRLMMADAEKLVRDNRVAVESLSIYRTKILPTKISDVQVQIDRLNDRKKRLANFQPVGEPQVSPQPIRPRIKFNLVLAAVASLTLAVVAVFLVDYTRRAFRRSAVGAADPGDGSG